MDVQTAITPMTSTQLLILWTLLGFLLAWMLLFALLAVRPETKKQGELEDVAVYPAMQQTVAPASKKLQVTTTQQSNYIPATVSTISHETSMVLEQSQ